MIKRFGSFDMLWSASDNITLGVIDELRDSDEE